MALTVPASLRAAFATRPEAGAWLDSLPAAVEAACARWDLVVEDEGPWHGYCALVVPVRCRDGSRAVLKVGWPHPEGEQEALGLRLWDGRGAVRLLATDGWTHLLERLEAGKDLDREPIDRALEVVAGLWSRLHVAAAEGVPRVSDDNTRWVSELPDQLARARVAAPHLADRLARLVDAAAPLLLPLGEAADAAGRLLHRDLHFYNVLAALPDHDESRGEWLAIDPKPGVGHPAFEVAPLLWNRWAEAVATGDPARECRRRADLVGEVGDLDRADVAAWVVVRQADNAVDAVAEGAPEVEVHLAIGEAFLPRL